MTARSVASLIALGLLAACQPALLPATPTAASEVNTATATAEQEASRAPGNNLATAKDANPLSGEKVADPSLLKTPALLVSISHFPATARPQAGLSFAPFVYEFYITEGATRFLAVFYGESPAPEIPVAGGCETRTGPFVQSATVLGNQVWLDSNGNGQQDPGEGGVSGLCVNLYDSAGRMVQRTSTDSNGYYGFNVQPGQYSIEFVRPDGLRFTKQNEGSAVLDSNADPDSGRAEVNVTTDDLSVDAGLFIRPKAAPTRDPSVTLPLAQVGPVRSGRLIYSHIADYFQKSCLIYAFASPEVLARLPQCHMVFHQLVAGGYMMDINEMRSVAQENMQEKGSDFNYASNVYSTEVPPGGDPASLLRVYFSYQNQSGWVYDPLYQGYLRYVDTAEYDQAGELHPDVDRLTGRQLHVENLIVLFAKHKVVSPTNLDIHLDQGRTGDAVLFRSGRMFKIKWSTTADPSAKVGEVRPIRFLGADGEPMPLAPGHTWVIVVTPDSNIHAMQPGQWVMNFTLPPGAN